MICGMVCRDIRRVTKEILEIFNGNRLIWGKLVVEWWSPHNIKRISDKSWQNCTQGNIK